MIAQFIIKRTNIGDIIKKINRKYIKKFCVTIYVYSTRYTFWYIIDENPIFPFSHILV